MSRYGFSFGSNNILAENSDGLTYEQKIQLWADKLNAADAILVGGASGMSAASGFRHYYEPDEHFVRKMSGFQKKYGYSSGFDGLYHRYRNSNERWGFFARWIGMILEAGVGETYTDIAEILAGKNFHIMTTNQDFQFEKVFGKEKVSAVQGDWRYIQCSRRCHDEIYNAEELYPQLDKLLDENLCLADEHIPHCEKCGQEMEPWVRSPVFLEGKKYADEYRKIREFLDEWGHKNIVFLELGVGRMTPMFIQEPFWQLTHQLPHAFYITVNPHHAIVPKALEHKGLAVHEDILKAQKDLLKLL